MNKDIATMKSTLVFLALVALSQGVPMTRNLETRIVNGVDAKPGEIPFQVSLQNPGSNFHFCGGSVLNKNYVITAAHCVKGKNARSIQIVAGSLHLNYPKSVHPAVKIIVHEKYNEANSWINDIALIKTNEPFVVSKALDYVALPVHGQRVPADSVAVVSGWGRLWEGGSSPKKLQLAKIQIAAQDYCSKTYKRLGLNVHNTQICAHDTETETGSCHGDSGGPLTVDGKLVGLVSWSNGCARVDYPTVYTRVPEYIDWINKNAV